MNQLLSGTKWDEFKRKQLKRCGPVFLKNREAAKKNEFCRCDWKFWDEYYRSDGHPGRTQKGNEHFADGQSKNKNGIGDISREVNG